MFVFSVHTIEADLSDHCQISIYIHTHICTDNIEEKLNPLPDKLTWKEDYQFLFQQALNSNDIQNRIKLFMKKDFDKTDSPRLNAAADFSNIIKDEATMSLKSTGNRKTLAGEIMEIIRKEMKI